MFTAGRPKSKSDQGCREWCSGRWKAGKSIPIQGKEVTDFNMIFSLHLQYPRSRFNTHLSLTMSSSAGQLSLHVSYLSALLPTTILRTGKMLYILATHSLTLSDTHLAASPVSCASHMKQIFPLTFTLNPSNQIFID